jgi:GNAT superfamily N-acetyltransferase
MSSVHVTTPHGTLTTRPQTAADAPFLFALFAAAKMPEMALMPMDAAGKQFLLQMQFRSMTATYRQQYPNARFEIVELDGQAVGRLVTDVQPDCVYYVDIAVIPERQRGGLATALMTAVLEEPRRLGLPGRVKVMAGNIASIRLCQRLGMTPRSEQAPFVELEWRPTPLSAAPGEAAAPGAHSPGECGGAA